ncbi:DUF1223 domain-containing protein [Thalassococcus sp. BH17M4-6]|uniref:DUF1223 domain-containing protein n=1 Tax=Thalassococcus sp. BH17M4-6 TaxID=3413148 RepID=UPI003BED5B56
MRLLARCTIALWLALAGGVQAQSNPVVVELFTSQGCSSCPPADALLAKLGHRDDVIALALHVDYWDYIGWKDKFASPAYTARQKGYARANGRSRIYTPQMIVNGVHDVVGNRPMDVSEIIQKQKRRATPVSVRATRSGDRVVVVVSTSATVASSDIHLVQYDPVQTVDIRRGENAGRTLSYSHIVRNWQVIGTWNGRGTYETSATVRGSAPLVVLVQGQDYGPVFAAARLR